MIFRCQNVRLRFAPNLPKAILEKEQTRERTNNLLHFYYLVKFLSLIIYSFSTMQGEKFLFTYNGLEYDATDYADKHPGGVVFLQNMKAITKDFTEYFRALHSDSAEKMLYSFPVVSKGKPTKSSLEYMEIYKKVQGFNQPLWEIQILLALLVATLWFIGCMTSYSVISIICFALTQILVGWIGHSAVHSRNIKLNTLGRVQSALFGGLSVAWWSPKHNMHHMFTNIQKYDQDIQVQYKVYLYEFLYLKWRFDSLVQAVVKRNYLDVLMILFNYACLAVWHHNILNWVIAQLVSSFYSAYLLIGNHERETRYAEKPDVNFIDHQILTSRNYREDNIFWLLIMGGMQFQAQHHLFPQIPFYRLPAARTLIIAELARLKKSLIYGPVL